MIDCIIIGGGPAGLMAAGTVAEAGKKVLVLEKMDKPCLKLGITGKGRCNLANINETKELLKQFNSGKRFLKYALHEFSNHDLMQFFETKGVKLKVERGNRVFPASGKAFQIVGALKDWCRSLKVEVKTRVHIQKIITKHNLVTGVVFIEKREEKLVKCQNLIIATGGKSYPQTGSTGDGYEMAKRLGHKIIKPKPSLVPLFTENKTHVLDNLKLKNVNITLKQEGKKICEKFGELYFTDFGIDGPVTLTISNYAIKQLMTVGKVNISIDLKPGLSHKQLKNRLIREISDKKNRNLRDVVYQLLPVILANYCLKELQLPINKKCTEITAEERQKIRIWLKEFTVQITGYKPLEDGIVTAGGINLKEIDSTTMRSKIIYNLIFAGEILDVDAQTGGYNLQAAFSTGYVAGKSIN